MNLPVYRWAIPLFSILVGLSIYVSFPHEPSVPKDYTLPGDKFDKATIQQIEQDLGQYNVGQTAQDHEVYMVTGGIGVADPRIMGWDSGGNMGFGFNGPPGNTYQIQEYGQDPMSWKKVIPHGKLNPKTKKGMIFTYEPLHWIKHTTKAGKVYYKLDDPKQGAQYFFQEGKTYIVVIPFPRDEFPTGLMTHLEPIGNPVKKQP